GRAGAGGGGSGEVERDDGEDEPGRVRPELPGWQVSQCGVFQVGVDLFDDGVAAVDGIGGDGVERLRVAGGEERVVSPQGEQRVLAVAGGGVEVGDAAHHQPPGELFVFAGERGERHFGDLGPRHPPAGVGVEHRVWVVDSGPGGVVDAGDGRFDLDITPHGDRHVGASP